MKLKMHQDRIKLVKPHIHLHNDETIAKERTKSPSKKKAGLCFVFGIMYYQ